MENRHIVLGLDIGGTKISSGLNNDGLIYKRKETATPFSSPKDKILNAISDQISEYLPDNFKAIGIGIPGLIDPHKGIVYNLANIPSFQQVGLKDYLMEKFNVPVYINNDANCFALGEYKYGPVKQYRHVIGITLGTGIGTGIIADSKLYTGFICGAGEWGGVPYLGKTFEDYCGSRFFKSQGGESAKKLSKRALEKDPEALGIFARYGEHLGKLIHRILFTYAPEAIVIGGSIKKACPYFRESMMATVQTFPYKSISENLKIYFSELDDSAILGATSLADNPELHSVNNKIPDTETIDQNREVIFKEK